MQLDATQERVKSDIMRRQSVRINFEEKMPDLDNVLSLPVAKSRIRQVFLYP